MHAQIKASPDTVGENIRAVVDALAGAGINIEAISPDFDPPHVRVLVEHDVFDAAIDALQNASLEPTIVRCAELVRMPNKPTALKLAMDAIEGQGHTLESILVLANRGTDTLVSFGVAGVFEGSWDEAAADDLRDVIEAAVNDIE